MSFSILRGAALAALLATSAIASAAPRLDSVFSDNAVIQREQSIHVTGEADPGEALTVTIGGQERRVTADASGRWIAAFQPMEAGGPHRLTVTAKGGAAQVASNILVGDVWLCSGQSNMEWPVRRSLNGEAEAQQAKDDEVRLLTIPHKTALERRQAFEERPAWQPLSPESAAEFSAACYFMARDLRKSVKVPFGLIDASWGGTRIRPWMDEAAARASGSGRDVGLLALYRSDPSAAARNFAEHWGEWWRGRTGQTAGTEPWNASSRLDWKPFPQIGPWEQWGIAELAEFNGLVWARRRFTLTPEQASQPATLMLGVVDDLDQTWVNGIGVGSSYGWDNPREYSLAPGVLRAGENEVIVNIGDSWSFGGFHGPAERLKLSFAGSGEVPLGEGWEYSIVSADPGSPPRAPWDSHAGLGTIYNAMVAPLGPVGLKGIAWYQGESDVGVAGYDDRLTALIASWRQQFRDPDLPFLVVGLAGFGMPGAEPTGSGWAQLQDEQRRAAMRNSATVLVPALDLGERADIHPPNKQEVGRRLALAARTIAYGDAGGRIAPMPVAASLTADGVRVEFTGSLRSLSGARPIGLELCGETQESCRYADALIDGKSVVIASDGRPASRVRHAWNDFAIVNLYSGDLPAPTFELEID
ncbi:MAG TPA: sialate O-acetylesterase [Sphingomicrobium sp.]|nr:sialate O-acetylesterase [Sphingomicrobium sp.]